MERGMILTARLTMLLASALLAAAIVGCGGSSSDGGGSSGSDQTVTTSSLTKAQYIKKASAICTESQQSRQQQYLLYAEQHSGEEEEELLAHMIPAVVIPGLEKRDAELRELGAPAGEEAQVEEVLDALYRIIEIAKGLNGGPPTTEYQRSSDEALKVTKKYGLAVCNG